MDLLQSLLALMTPIGLALFALLITREGQKDRAAENARRDARDEADRQQRVKDNQQFMLLFATITGKQVEGTAQAIKSGVDSEGRLSAQVTTAEANIKGRVQTVGDANIARLDKIDKALMLIQTAINLYSDPSADVKYDRALEILTAKLEAVKDDLAGVKTDTAANTDARVLTAEMSAVDVPAEVVITDVSPAAVDTIVSAMGAGAATEGGEGEDKVA